MKGGFDRRKSLQELEGHDWGEPTYDSSLVTTCHRLHRKPLNEFSVGDLRIMIGQGISLSYLIPLAVERLEEEPLVEGTYYRGDLLAAVVGTDESFWSSHPDSLHRIRQIVCRAKTSVLALDEHEGQAVREVLETVPRLLVK